MKGGLSPEDRYWSAHSFRQSIVPRVQKAPLRPRSQLALQLGSHRVSPTALGKCVLTQLG